MKCLNRRSFLRGAAGAAVGLPMLDAMRPAFAAAAKSGASAPVRMAFTYVPNGIIMNDWTPTADGASFELKSILEPMAAFRKQSLIMTGLSQVNGRALGDGPGDHARAASTFLTGVHPKKTAGADIKVGISADQVAAQAIGSKTRFASLELGIEHGRIVGNCDSGYSCAYSNSISWRTESLPNPPEVNPRLVFERLFGSSDFSEPADVRARRERQRRSILDFVREDTASLQTNLGAADRRKLDEYLTGVREIEKRIQMAEKNSANTPQPEFEKPNGIPVEFTDHARLMFDLMVVAFQTDSTRVATFMLGREGSNQTYRSIGVPDAHHGISHHKGDEEKIGKLAKINRHHMEQYAYFLGRLASIKEGDGTLLDNCMLVYGSGLADGNRHTHHDLPVLFTGSGQGAFRTGRHIQYTSETPLTNLFLTMLDRMGVRPETIGDSRGRLEHLTDL